MNPTESFISMAALAKRWSMHPESLRRMFREGRITATKVSNRVRVPMSEVIALEDGGMKPRGGKPQPHKGRMADPTPSDVAVKNKDTEALVGWVARRAVITALINERVPKDLALEILRRWDAGDANTQQTFPSPWMPDGRAIASLHGVKCGNPSNVKRLWPECESVGCPLGHKKDIQS